MHFQFIIEAKSKRIWCLRLGEATEQRGDFQFSIFCMLVGWKEWIRREILKICIRELRQQYPKEGERIIRSRAEGLILARERVKMGKGESKDDQGSRHSKVKEKLGGIVSGDRDSIEVELYSFVYGLPRWFSGKEPACQYKRLKRYKFNPWGRKIPWQPTPVFFPGKSYRQRILVGYSPKRHRVKYDLATEHACSFFQRS